MGSVLTSGSAVQVQNRVHVVIYRPNFNILCAVSVTETK